LYEGNPLIIVHGFCHVGIYDTLRLIDYDDLPEYVTSNDDGDELDNEIDTLVGNTKQQF